MIRPPVGTNESRARCIGSALGFSILPAYLLVFAVFMIAMTELTFRTAEKNRSDTGP